MSIWVFLLLLLRNGASGPVVKYPGLRAGVWELIIVDGDPRGMKHGAGRGHGRQAHESWHGHDLAVLCVATCAGRGPWGWSAPWAPCDNTRLPGPGVRSVLHHQDLGPGVQEGEQHPVYTWPRSVPSPSFTIHREATPCQLFGKCQSRWISSYLSTESPEIPERTMQPRRKENEISN